MKFEIANTFNIVPSLDSASGEKPETLSFGKWLRTRPFIIRLVHWEFWPFELLYIPAFVYVSWLFAKSRSFFFYSAANPSIEGGGMLGESKTDIFKQIDDRYIPEMVTVEPDEDIAMLKKNILEKGLDFPLIAKPDIGERGKLVEKISDMHQLESYLEKIKVKFIIQEYIDYPVELGIFYYRYPNREKGKISSITYKETLKVTGDGKSTVRQLILKNPRAILQLKRVERDRKDLLERVPGNNEKLELVPIGNHCLGTRFLDGNYLINDRLVALFDRIASEMGGFYFGRFDIKCQSIEELYQGKRFSILEINGAGSEPGHIYDPGFTLWRAYGVIIDHLKVLYEISKINHTKGVSYMSVKEGWNLIKKVRQQNRLTSEAV